MLQVSITVTFNVRIRYQYQSKIHAFYPLTLFTIPSPKMGFTPLKSTQNIKHLMTLENMAILEK